MKFSLLLVVIVHLFFIHTSICCPVNAKAVRRFGGRIYPIDGSNSPWTCNSDVHVFLVPRFIKNKHQIKPGGSGRLWIFRQRRTCLEDADTHICPLKNKHICFKSDHDALDLHLNVTSKRHGYSRVVARWKPLFLGDIVNQTISVTTRTICGNHTGDAEHNRTFVVNTTATSFRVLNIRANSKVLLNLTVQTYSGKVYYQTSCIKTDPSAPTGPPRNVTARVKRRLRRLTFRWAEPKCQQTNGEIERYEFILYRSAFKKPETGNTTKKFYTFHRLRLNEHYSFDVRAKTKGAKGGAGPYSRPVGGYF